MVQICISDKTHIDIYEKDGFYADISLPNNHHQIGPAYDLALLNRYVLDFLHDITSQFRSQESQLLEVQALQNDLVNCQLEEWEL